MNKASRGFGLTSVVLAVIFLAVTAVFSSNADSAQLSTQSTVGKSSLTQQF